MATAPSTNGSRSASSAVPGAKAGPALTLTIQTEDFSKTPFTVVGWTGTEEISQLFHHEVDFVAGLATPIAFHKVLGKPATLNVSGHGSRRGVIGRLTEEQPSKTHAHYRAEITHPLWFATKIAQSRVFQDLDVLDIIKAVIAGWPKPAVLDEFRIRGRYPKRPYCVQYRETDFHFLNRLMEEEGIYYFFHPSGPEFASEYMVISDEPLTHPHSLGELRLDRDSRNPQENS